MSLVHDSRLDVLSLITLANKLSYTRIYSSNLVILKNSKNVWSIYHSEKYKKSHLILIRETTSLVDFFEVENKRFAIPKGSYIKTPNGFVPANKELSRTIVCYKHRTSRISFIEKGIVEYSCIEVAVPILHEINVGGIIVADKILSKKLDTNARVA